MAFCAMDIAGYVGWFPTITLLFIVIWIGLSIVFMLSRLINKPEGEAWAKTEMYATFVSYGLVFLMFGISELLCMSSLSLTEGQDPFQVAGEYLSKFSNNLIPTDVAFIWEISKDVRKGAYKIVGYSECTMGGCITWDAGNTYTSDQLDLVSYFTMPFAAGLMMQKLVLMLIEDVAFTMVVPAGFVLKLFPYTRAAGAYLIAMGFAFYFLFPMSYVLADAIYKETKGEVFKLEIIIDSMGPGEYLHFGGAAEAFGAITRLAAYGVYAHFLPMLGLLMSIVAAQALFQVFSTDFLEGVVQP